MCAQGTPVELQGKTAPNGGVHRRVLVVAAIRTNAYTSSVPETSLKIFRGEAAAEIVGKGLLKKQVTEQSRRQSKRPVVESAIEIDLPRSLAREGERPKYTPMTMTTRRYCKKQKGSTRHSSPPTSCVVCTPEEQRVGNGYFELDTLVTQNTKEGKIKQMEEGRKTHLGDKADPSYGGRSPSPDQWHYPDDQGISAITRRARGIVGGRADTGRAAVCALLQRNLDIFAWEPKHMTGVPRSITEHKLKIRQGYSLVRQKKRGQAPERAKAILEEVHKLVEAAMVAGGCAWTGRNDSAVSQDSSLFTSQNCSLACASDLSEHRLAQKVGYLHASILSVSASCEP
ncbi:hypothetical protein Tco_1030327 [Tanacetum coccineum]|uniref:Reverse transcriptase domain-containing protein n=1 Tax=Tanacetum coccineum TaxID=301880 RepID=A0ABQ5G5X1_9ASTR